MIKITYKLILLQAFDTFPYSASDAANEVTVIANKLRRRISL